MARVRVQAIRHLARSGERLAALPQDVIKTLYDQLDGYIGQELEVERHTQRLSVEGHVVAVGFFVDVDGTLWIERLGPDVQ